jgi:hypothetical protein
MNLMMRMHLIAIVVAIASMRLIHVWLGMLFRQPASCSTA